MKNRKYQRKAKKKKKKKSGRVHEKILNYKKSGGTSILE